MKNTDRIKAEKSELAALRQRVETLSLRLKIVFCYHIFCIAVFVLYLFKIVHGISLQGIGNAAEPIMLAGASAVAMLPLFVLMILSYSKSKKATKALVALSFVFLTATLIETTLCELSAFETILGFPSVILLLPCYALVFAALIIYKNKRNAILTCGLSLIVYCILCLGNEINNVIYPHILFMLSAVLNLISLEYIKEYDTLSKIYGFPYFNERFNEQKSEYIPTYNTNDIVSYSPDEVSITDEIAELDSAYSKGENLMETIDVSGNCDDVRDMPFSDKSKVDEYTQKLRSLKNKK